MKRLTLLFALACLTSWGYAQKKPLDHSVYDSWQRIRLSTISDKGTYASYLVSPQEGDDVFYMHNTAKKNQTFTIDRIQRYFITPNEKYFIGAIKPKFAQTKAHKENKGKKEDAPKDTLVVATLPLQRLDTLGAIKSYKIGKEGNQFYAYLPEDVRTQEEKKDSIEFNKPLVIKEFGSSWCDTIDYVDSYYFSKNGTQLAILTQPEKKDSITPDKELIFYDLSKKEKKTISKGYFKYLTPEFNETGDLLAFYAAKDTVLPTDKSFELFLYKQGHEEADLLIGTDYTQNLPEGWFFTENSTLSFSHKGDKLFSSVAPLTLPSDTITYKEEKAALDIWHYQDPVIQPGQLVNRNREAKRTYTAVLYLDQANNLVPISQNPFESVWRVNRGDADFAIVTDNSKNIIATQWEGSTAKDIYQVDYKTGKRKLLLEDFKGSVSPSPQGKYLLLYQMEDSNWYSYNLATDQLTNLTSQLDVNFWNEKEDYPGKPYPYGSAGWTADDQKVLLYDAYDIWEFDPTAQQAPRCLTQQAGRKNNLKYRIVNLDREQRFFSPKEELLIEVFNTNNKDAALASLNLGRPAQPKLLTAQEPIQYNSIIKAKEAQRHLFIKSNFEICPDIHFTSNQWRSSSQLSHINPQKEEYNWGTAELFHWHAFDGKKLDGIVYKPEDFDPSKKYPVMIYFYETHSDNLNAHHMPQPSWSIINISFYVSRGYVVFSPDIHYTTGMPGESAYNCIVSGAEALAKNSWIDKDNMAIQGQSWGGYQVAYLVTRTNLFKAAGSGAPVSNMTSAYGGIRWGTGSSRQLQYEIGQSRIGGTLWDCPELYLLNSPIFRVDKIETPLLIMHNDEDGAVPWYQGIEMYMGMRRLQKPVWMLQYNGEQHNLVKRVNRKDLSIRLQQFFDHYLKGAPAPEWMVEGVPAIRKGKTWGTDLVE